MNQRFYLLKISLQDIEPLIWRRFVVPASISLDRLHDVIQIVMGWEDYHQHEFIIGKKHYTGRPESRGEGLEDGRYRLDDLVTENGSVFMYNYDFGDSWQHDVILEDSSYNNPELSSLLECIDGERACPPEDIGGVPGYNELCRELNDSDQDDDEVDDEDDEDDEWDDEEYDSEEFDIGIANHELMIYQHWSRDRQLTWVDNG